MVIKFDLSKLKAAYNELALKDLKVIQVVGTNGKGSTSRFLKAMLEAKGLRVGLFSSPHPKAYQGIEIDEMINEELYLSLVSKYDNSELSAFEKDVLVALTYFKDKVDYVILEAGLGGLYDATNVVPNKHLVALTSISYDHGAFLGTSLSSIAIHKSLVVNQGTKLISSYLSKDLNNLVKLVCETNNAKYQLSKSLSKQQLSLFKHSKLPAYQLNNLALALSCLKELGYQLKLSELALILANFKHSLRFQIVSEEPLIIIDGAHNIGAINALLASSSTYQIDEVLFSCLKDKEVEKMLKRLGSKYPTYLTNFKHERSFSDEEFLELSYPHKIVDWQAYLAEAYKLNKGVLVCGSLYFSNEVLVYLKGKIHG